MKLRVQSALPALLLVCVLAGCRHKAPPPPPPVAAAPPAVSPSSITVITPLPSVPPETKADVKPAPPDKPAPPAPVQPVKRTHRLRKKQPPAAAADAASAAPAAPAGPTAPAPSPAPPTLAAAPVPAPETTPAIPKVSPAQEAAPSLGELSTGTTIGSQEKTRMLGEIQVQEGRLSKVKEGGTSDAEAVRMQIRTFLTKARQAIAENDLDGAQTLNTKARVLLDELKSE